MLSVRAGNIRRRGENGNAHGPCVWTLVVGLLLCFVCAQARAQDIHVEASADRTASTLDDPIRLDVVVKGRFQGRPELRGPAFADFRVASSGESQSYTILNGQLDASYTFTFVLFPLRAGDLTIPPFVVSFRGKDYSTRPIRVQVRAQAPAPGPPVAEPGEARDLFVVARVDKERAYVNEQVLYTFFLYYAVRVSNLNYTPPPFEGFWVEKLQEGEKQYHKIINGRRYLVVEVTTALFPTTSGTLNIEPALLRLMEITERGFSFFDRGVERVLRSRPVEVEVLPLPANARPADFDGAVGEDLELTSRIDRTNVPEGEPITMTVSVSGAGNVRTFSKPRLPELPAFKTYDAESKTDARNLDRVTGTRTFEIVLVPRGPGEFTVPPVRFSYFDTRSGSYKSLETPPQRVVARPVAGGSTAQAPPALQQDIEVLGRDIAHIRADVDVSDTATPLYARGFFMLFAPVPFAVVAVAFFVQRRRDRLAADVALARSSRARKVAHKRLAQAERLLVAGKHAEFHAEVQRALLQYVGDKLNTAAAGLTHAALRAQLEGKGASEDTRERLIQVLEHCDAARFAPGSATPERMRATLQEVQALVVAMEEGWNRKTGRFALPLALVGGAVLAAALLAVPVSAQEKAANQSVPPPVHVQESPQEYVPPQELLRRGHAAYEAGRYAEAIAAYERAEALGVRNGPLYYNLGNACFKNGALGQAIAHYRRAERLLPRDALVRQNLEFALARREDKAAQAPVPFPLSLLRAVYVRLSLNECILWTACLYALVCGLLVYRTLRHDRRLLVRLTLPTVLALFVLMASTLAIKIHDERGIQRGVIGLSKISVMSGPGTDYTVEFWLHEGSEVKIEESRPDWLRVSVGAKLRGWIPAGSVVRI